MLRPCSCVWLRRRQILGQVFLKITHAHVWMRMHCLPRVLGTNTLFAFDYGIDTPLSIDDLTRKIT